MRDIVLEIAREKGLNFKLAVIQAEQDKAYLKQMNRDGRIEPLGPIDDLTDAAIDASHRTVAMMGVEPFQKEDVPALRTIARVSHRDSRFYFEGAWHEAPIYNRDKLHTDLAVDGPAIVLEMDSTTVVLPGYTAAVDRVGNLLINPKG